MSAPGTLIKYNGQQILAGQPTPFVGRQDSFIHYGSRWADKTTISLAGQITGCTYDDLIAAQNRLLNIFNTDFQTLQIIENGSGIFSADFVTIGRITFPSSPYSYSLNYNVTLDCYQENLFSGVYGVLDPIDEWSYEERPDYTVGLTHTVSARGFNTSSSVANALDNAKNFVTPRMGLTNAVTPVFVNLDQPTLSFCLKDLRETINRYNGSYAVEETYLADSFYGTDGLLRFTTNFDCNSLDGLAKVTVEGNIDGCGRASSMSTIRARYNGLDLFSLAEGAFTDAGGGGTLNSIFVSDGVIEDTFNKKITFTRTYDNNPDPTVFIDYSITLATSENDITTVTFDGVIKGRGDLASRWAAVQAFYSTFDSYSYAAAAYATLGLPYPLNTIPIKDTVSFNQFNAEIAISQEWNNKDIPPAGFKNFSYTMHFTPAFQKVAYSPLSNVCGLAGVDSWYVVDLGFKTRCAFSVDGNATVCLPATIPDAIVSIRQIGNALFSVYCPSTSAVLEKKEIGSTTDLVNFNFGWSAVSPLSITQQGSYATISNLGLK